MTRWTSALLLTLTFAAPSSAQVATGTLAGSVTDSSGAVVPHATVVATDETSGLARTAPTDETGGYHIAGLPPGTYGVAASASGFDRRLQRIVVSVDTTVRVDFALAIAPTSQRVDVVATTPTLQTMSGDLGTVFDRQRIETLPLNKRDFLQLALLTPGVEGPVDNSELSTRGGVAMHVSGAREESNDYLLDGVDNNDAYVNRYVVQPPVDSIEEFKVAANSYSAEYGRNAGGQVNVVTRRGTNRFDGAAYEYFRDRSLNAGNYFETDKQPFRRNQFGGDFGGPIAAGRTFFFGSVDLLREDETLSRLGSVPSLAARSGNLSALGGPVMDPFTGAPFSGNVIPASRISPLARQVVNLFPAPNRTDSAVNYLGQPAQTDDETQGTVRVDHQLTASDRLMARYNGGHVDLFEPYVQGTGVTAGFGDFVHDRTWNATVQHEHLFAASAVNSLRFGANGFTRDLLTQNNQTNAGAQWGVGWLNVPAASFGYPSINVAGYSSVGDSATLPILRDSTTYQVIDDLTITRGAHLLKMGGDWRHVALDSKVDLFSRGMLSFTGAFTGSGIGDLLLGLPTFGIQAQVNNQIQMRTDSYAAYLQDDWRVARRLTLNLGVRYEYVTPPVDANNDMTTLDFATGKLVGVGTNGVSQSGIQPDRNNFAPRLGASWSVNDDTVVRGGYGIFYDSGMLTVNTAQYFNPPQFNLRVFFPSAQGLLTLDNPFPTHGGFVPPATLSILDPNLKTSYLQHWNAALERTIKTVGTVTVAYAGSKGANLVEPININQALPGPGDVQGRRPYPQYSDMFLVTSNGASRYDSLQLSFNRPLARSVSVFAAYTLAKSMDDASSFLGTPADTNFPQDSRNLAAEWAPSSYDVRHRLTVAYIVTLPQNNRITRDMQIEGITVAHSGQPFTPILQFDNSNSGNTGGTTAGSDRPNLVGNPDLADPTADEWFNTAAFVVPAKYTFGNAGRNSVRGPAYASFDLAVRKRLAMGTRGGVTISLQAFNLFNRTNFDLPEHYVDNTTTFGKIFSAKAPRQVQLMARFGF